MINEEFLDRKLFNLLRTYGEYKIASKTEDIDKKRKLEEVLLELIAELRDPYDTQRLTVEQWTHSTETVRDIVKATCDFMSAAVQLPFSTVPVESMTVNDEEFNLVSG